MNNQKLGFRETMAVFVLVLMCQSGSAFAQMTLISSSPTNGSTNVTLPGSISLTFSQPIDTTADFGAYGFGFFMNLEIYPEETIIIQNNVTFLDDMKTVVLGDLQLVMDTQYVLILSGVKSTTGDLLDEPVVLTFTTGSALPTTSVSGKIDYQAGDPRKTVVKLVDIVSNHPTTIAATVITSTDGSYTIPFVKQSNPECVAILDENQDGILDPAEGDIFGTYDPNFDHDADQIEVSNLSITGIDFEIKPVTLSTAHIPLETLIPLIQKTAPSLQLCSVWGVNVNENGKAPIWYYDYYSPDNGIELTFASIGDWIFLQWMELNGPAPELLPPDYWHNSDYILSIAESNGGSAFRAAHADWKIYAILGPEDILGNFFIMSSTEPDNFSNLKLQINSSSHFSNKPNIFKNGQSSSFTSQTSSGTYWIIIYESMIDTEILPIYIDAQTGSMILPQTAAAQLSTIKDKARKKAVDARLEQVSSGSLDEKGASQFWNYLFISESQMKKFIYRVNGPAVTFVYEDTLFHIQSPLSENWIDSNIAQSLVEEKSGSAFRALYPDCQIFGVLSFSPMFLQSGGPSKSIASEFSRMTELQSNNVPPLAFWHFSYWSESSLESFVMAVDAVSQRILVPTTAKESLEAAKLRATTWAADARLTAVDVFYQPMTMDGHAESWMYEFYSEVQDSIYELRVYKGSALEEYVSYKSQPPQEISDTWIDSDTMLTIAETHGGAAFQSTQDSVEIFSGVRYGPVLSGPAMLYWYVQYDGNNDKLILYFNAETGDVITAVNEDESKKHQADSFFLYQNYPNPFNPQTTIQYNLHKSSHITLDIYNLSGQKIVTLINEFQTAGPHEITWQPEGLSSGIYFYELKVGEYTKVKTLILQK